LRIEENDIPFPDNQKFISERQKGKTIFNNNLLTSSMCYNSEAGQQLCPRPTGVLHFANSIILFFRSYILALQNKAKDLLTSMLIK
jgi:hypothetical protein